MKLNAAQLERTTTQLQAEVIPEDHPLIPQLNRMFGDHTYLLDSNGLIIVEPAAAELAPDTAGMGSWCTWRTGPTRIRRSSRRMNRS